MKVLVVHNRYRSAQPSGENVAVDDETALLAEHGVDVRRLTTDSDDIAGFSAPQRALLPARVVWSRSGRRLVERALRDEQPDVVHVHNTFPLLSPAVLWTAARSGAAVVQTLHNFRPLCANGALFHAGAPCEDCLGRMPALAALRHGCYRDSRAATVPVAAMGALHRSIGTWRRCVHAFVVPSAFGRSKYAQAGWAVERFHVKPNTAFDPGLRREGVGDGFLFVGRLGPEKGADVLLDAWRRAFPDGGQRLDVVGSGELEDDLRAAAEGADGVHFHGQLPFAQVLELMARARALVFPTLAYELFPRTVAEAYAVGLPVLASRRGSVAEIVVDGETGLLVEPRDADALAAGLRRLAGDDALSRRLGAGARDAYERLYSPQATTARLLDIYADAIARAADAGRRLPAITVLGEQS